MPPFGGQSVRDKTLEFRAVADRLRKEQGGLGGAGPSGAQPNGAAAQAYGPSTSQNGAISQQSDFARKAGRIGQGIHGTSQKLQKLAQLAKRTSKTRLKDTTKDFKDVLTKRTEVLKSNQDRRNLFSIRPDEGQSWARPSTSQPHLQEQPLFGEAAFKGNMQTSSEDGTGSSSSERTSFLSQSSQQQQLQLMQPQDTYLTSRAEALHNVESTITELGGIFQQLAHMVQEQGELTVRIDENVEETLANVDSAQAQLLKYLNSISSNRWLIMKVFFVLLAFLVIFVVFIA
ncbi:hypothetical protein WJX84_004823 [Apatococcus fuscideae]|uniref:t-SNARE coiled-coil homology domain-containing protein n=1 Tax=Apatococcus fuscideae TaxID=2026836 RepID=A0AAW1T4K3_9CHLO